MTRRGIRGVIDALAEGRRPPRIRAHPDELEDLRTAITLSAARPGESSPDPRFVEDLFADLAAAQSPPAEPSARVKPLPRRGRKVMLSLAAAAALIAGTVGVTESVDHGGARPAASAFRGHTVLTGSLETADHHKLGQITVFGGSPSWVFMNVSQTPYDGPVTCLLESHSGSAVAMGRFTVQGGSGEFARPLPDGVTNLRGARIVTSSGITLAAATFTSLSGAD